MPAAHNALAGADSTLGRTGLRTALEEEHFRPVDHIVLHVVDGHELLYVRHLDDIVVRRASDLSRGKTGSVSGQRGVVGVEGRNRIVSYLLEDAGVYLRIKRINASYLYGVLRLWLKAQANSTHGLSRGQIKVIPLHLAG